MRLRIATSRIRAAMICWLSGHDSSLSCSITLSSSGTEARHDFVAAIAANLTTNCFYYRIRRAGTMIHSHTHRDQSLTVSMLASVQRFKRLRHTAIKAP